MKTRSLTVWITPDATAATAAFANMRRSLEAFIAASGSAAEALAQLGRRVRITRRDQHIRRYGPLNVDTAGTWQSDLCAAWVHFACPSDYCDCTCHGGTVR